MRLVTGPTGNVGTQLVALAAERGVPDLRVAAHHPDALRQQYPQLDAVAFDYDDSSGWPAVLDGVTSLFLLFPLPQPKTVRTRMKPFIDAAAAAGVRHVVYVSVPGADRQRVVPHHAVEKHLAASGMTTTILRPSYFFQNMVRAISTHGVDVVESGEVFVPAGKGTITFVDARDVAEVALTALEDPATHAGQQYLLTGSEALGFDDVAQAIGAALERPVRYTAPSMPTFWRRLRKRGVTRDTLLFMTIVYLLTRRGKNAPTSGDLPRLLGRPPTDLTTFAEDYRDVWRTRAWV